MSVVAPAMALDGELLGRTVSGARQREVAPGLGTVKLAFQNQTAASPFYAASPTPPKVVFGSAGDLPPVGAFDPGADGLPAARREEVDLPATLFTTSGFGNVEVDNPDGDIVVPAGVTLQAPRAAR